MAPTGLENWSRAGLGRLEDEQVAGFARAGCSGATEHLLNKYKGFVEGKARSYFLAGAEHEDVVQEGMIGLYKAIRDFRTGRFTRFRSFAELCVTRQIVTAVKSAVRNKHVPLNEYVSLQRSSSDRDDPGCIIDVMADPHGVDPESALFERWTLQSMQMHAQETLSELECEVLDGYLEGTSYQEMACDLGCRSKSIDNALQRAKRKVGQRLLELNQAHGTSRSNGRFGPT